MRASLPARRSCLARPLATIRTPSCLYAARRQRSTEAPAAQEPATASLSPRWLSDVKQRIGKCITFGLRPDQTQEAGRILREMARDWRELVAGTEGFLTGPHRRGLFRRRVIWGEQDAMGHVNNVLYNRYAETGRVEWTQKYARFIDPEHAKEWDEIVSPKGEGLILRKITTDFKFPMKYPDHISVYHKLGTQPDLGSNAFLFEVLIMSELHQRIAARVTEDCVLYDYRIGKKAPMQHWMVGVLRETWKLQEEAKQVNSARVRSLLERVRGLETGSWDRADAVEDMGSSSR